MSKSILAGILIAFAGAIYTSCENKIIGAFLFSIGLISVIVLEANLYTGKIGYVESRCQLEDAFVILVGNFAGAGCIGILYNCSVGSVDISSKLNKPWYTFMFASILCGVCIYIAVECYKQTKNIITIVIPVMAFILGGGEHSIADVFYFWGSDDLCQKAILYFGIAVIGNAFGSILIHRLQNVKDKY